MEKTPVSWSSQFCVVKLELRVWRSGNIQHGNDGISAVHVSCGWFDIRDNVSFPLCLWLWSSEYVVFNVNIVISIEDLEWINICPWCSWHTEPDPFSLCAAPGSNRIFSDCPISNWSGILRIIPRSFNCRTDSYRDSFAGPWRIFQNNQTSEATWESSVSSQVSSVKDCGPSDPRLMVSVVVKMESNWDFPCCVWKRSKNFNGNGLTWNSIKSSMVILSEIWCS